MLKFKPQELPWPPSSSPSPSAPKPRVLFPSPPLSTHCPLMFCISLPRLASSPRPYRHSPRSSRACFSGTQISGHPLPSTLPSGAPRPRVGPGGLEGEMSVKTRKGTGQARSTAFPSAWALPGFGTFLPSIGGGVSGRTFRPPRSSFPCCTAIRLFLFRFEAVREPPASVSYQRAASEGIHDSRTAAGRKPRGD